MRLPILPISPLSQKPPIQNFDHIPQHRMIILQLPSQFNQVPNIRIISPWKPVPLIHTLDNLIIQGIKILGIDPEEKSQLADEFFVVDVGAMGF